jgi:hypothetical protein
MNRRMPTPLTRVALSALATIAVISTLLAAQTPAPVRPPAATSSAPAPRTVATVKQLMHAIVIPSSEAIFKAAGEPPTTDAAWLAMEHQALALAESGNLLMIGSRVRDRGDWLKFSRALVDAAATAATAAAAKNADNLSTAGDAIYETCETCHGKYMKK